jgi:hypothetical protein
MSEVSISKIEDENIQKMNILNKNVAKNIKTT